MKGPSNQTGRFPYTGYQPRLANFGNRNIAAPTVIIGTTLALGGLILIIARRNARSTEIFTSPACYDIHITRHKDTGPTTVSGEGILERHKSEDHDLGEFHKQLRASQNQDSPIRDTAPLQSIGSSSTTLVDHRSESKVSLEDGSSGEMHKGLVELQMNGHTKAFFSLETGELFHLKHWKDKYKDALDHSYHKDNVGTS